jgi:hypothetical protein
MSYGPCQATRADGSPCDRAARSSRGLCRHHLAATRDRCTEPDCTDPGDFGRGLCQAHYNRHRRAGTLPPKLSPSELAAKAAGADVPPKLGLHDPEVHRRGSLTRMKPWNALARHGVLTNPKDMAAARRVQRELALIVGQKGGASTLATVAAKARHWADARLLLEVVMRELAEHGAFETDPDTGLRVPTAALAQAHKALANERGALVALGDEVRMIPAVTLADVMGEARALPEPAPLEAEVFQKAEATPQPATEGGDA